MAARSTACAFHDVVWVEVCCCGCGDDSSLQIRQMGFQKAPAYWTGARNGCTCRSASESLFRIILQFLQGRDIFFSCIYKHMALLVQHAADSPIGWKQGYVLEHWHMGNILYHRCF